MTPALAVFALVGCVAQEPQGDAGDRSGASSAKESAAGNYTHRLPIAAYSYTDDEYASIEAAENVLAGACMARYSLSFDPPRPAPAKPGPDRRYGLSDEKSASLFGYRPDPMASTRRPAQLGKDVRTVLLGKQAVGATGQLEYRGKKVPDDGCLGRAKHDLGKDYAYPEGSETASRISSQSYRDAMLRPEVRTVFKKWSDCMKKSGYTYTSPSEPFDSPAFREGPVSAQEKATAQADVACKRSTGLLDVWFTAESAVQKTMIAKHAGALRKLQALHRQKVAAAKKILSQG
ncbi:hypothetical protein [Streptomyces purpureus]|uniref:hypothetical protein n=1 Tax=Streptomyces purpureus TaxID=1951 RepID=UPI001E4D2F86|nr:hypothetical protein [Streptomyces purpureus]